MPIKKVQNLFNHECIKYVAYYLRIVELNNLSKTFLTPLYYISLKYCESCNTIYDIF